MNIQSMSVSMEKYVMPLANKLGNEIHLRAIRDAFMSLLPITFTGGIAAVLSSAPSVDAAGTGITLAWARFVESNSMIFSWINALTLGAMSLYICIGIIHFLCKSRKIESFLPILLGVCGFLMLIVEPMSLGWDGKMAELSYMDGKGLIPAMFISILTADLYCYMRKRDFGKISLPDTVPASLSDVFASIVPGAVLMVIYIALYAIMNKAGTTLPKLIYNAISPSLTAADSVGFTIIITLMVHIFWFFGIHDAALSGVLAPIRDGNLSINAAAHAAGPGPSIHIYHTILGIFCGDWRMWIRAGIDGTAVFFKIKTVKDHWKAGNCACIFQYLGTCYLWSAPYAESGIFCSLPADFGHQRYGCVSDHAGWPDWKELCHAVLADAFCHRSIFLNHGLESAAAYPGADCG